MSKRDDKDLIEDILNCISQIQEYIGSQSLEEFYADRKTRDAVLRNFTIIGEACRLFSQQAKISHPEIPFKKIIDFRNIIVHEYFGIDFELVWDVIQVELPEIKKELLRLNNLYK